MLDVYINVTSSQNTRCSPVQHNVKVAVQSMTGKPVNKVNVHIAGVVIEENKEASV